MQEKRKFSRVPFCHALILKPADGNELLAESANMSFRGGFFRLQESRALALNERVQFLMVLSKEENIFIEGDGHIVWSDGANGYGLSCDTMGIEYFSHLKRLIDLNVGNDSVIQKEIENFADITV